MEFLGVGPLELILVIVLALVVVGPRDLAKLGRDAGRFLNRLYRSPAWRTMNEASRELRNLPNRLAREAELDTLKHDLEQAGQTSQSRLRVGRRRHAGVGALGASRPTASAALRACPAGGCRIRIGQVRRRRPSPPPPPPAESPFAEG